MSAAKKHPHASPDYELFLARPRSRHVDWHTAGTAALPDLDLRVRLASGLAAARALMHALDAGRAQGRHVEWGAWLGPLTTADIRPLLHELGIQLPPDVEHLDDATPYFVVAVNSEAL